ncbi:hypothetical protein [Quisquiliibacterium transsilvanicum]|uniref:TubC N-terminal docking domain-containing protein n=1 Tax=Quisquiliibacterium transsilvanicum TaxID=1549638 RepID=A0A7W8M920_9BURK|nr:hypothetical protein [Quisquiliibacterium transsilvanicum]MBB5272232.1 hypothetical protein [Quisquiliibacterium transsilvanicum]
MNAHQVLDRLRTAGVTVIAEAGALVASPSWALTDELRALIRQHKTAILDLIALPQGVERRLVQMVAAGAIDVDDAQLVRARYYAFPADWDFLLDLCTQARREAKA